MTKPYEAKDNLCITCGKWIDAGFGCVIELNEPPELKGVEVRAHFECIKPKEPWLWPPPATTEIPDGH